MSGPGPVAEHGSAAPIEILPVTGLPEFRPGDDLAAAIITAAPWLRDGDVVVITSKVVSKCEGRIVAAPADPEQRDALRRSLIEEEAVRVLARKGRTLITANRHGLVQAAAGVDGSNVDTTELALLPEDPDASAARLRAELGRRAGVEIGVVLTDTMGRAWRTGQIDAAIGSAGVPVLHSYAGASDSHGNELLVTEVAVADEIAAAADLVKGKLTGVPVAVLRGLTLPDDGSCAAGLLRGGPDDPNGAIRGALTDLAARFDKPFVAPPLWLCTDNGAMIAWAGAERFAAGLTDDLGVAARPRWPLDPDAEAVRGAGVKA